MFCRKIFKQNSNRINSQINYSLFQRFYNLNNTIKDEKKWVLKNDLINNNEKEIWEEKQLNEKDIKEVNLKLNQEKFHSYQNKNKRNKYEEDLNNPYHISKMKGFLQLNPHICSGCGSHFQSKSPNNPGYLDKERFAEHRLKAERLRQVQNALKILDMSSINPESDIAMEILVKANIPPDIIDSVININRKMKKGVPKFKFQDSNTDSIILETSSPSPSPLSSSLSTSSQSSSSTSSESTPLVEELPILGYTKNLVPIYDIDTLLRTYSEEDKLYGKDVKNYDKIKNQKKKNTFSTEELSVEGGEIEQTKTIPDSDNVVEDADALPICQRCFRLQFYGQCEDILRPGWTSHEDLTPNKFANLLSVIRESTGVVLCLVDIFDLEGSLLPNIKHIAGKNPIVIVANKIDLLPSDVSMKRITDWIYKIARQKCELLTPKEAEEKDHQEYEQKGWYRSRENSEEGILRRTNIHLVSCITGTGIQDLLNNLLTLAKHHGDKIYVMGTANVGKSSFVNRLLDHSSKKKKSLVRKEKTPQATVSPIPGTTLDFLKILLPKGVLMIDTPGLINPSQLTSRLNTEELKLVIPTKQIHHITLRVEEKYCVLIGGLARIELVEVFLISIIFYILIIIIIIIIIIIHIMILFI